MKHSDDFFYIGGFPRDGFGVPETFPGAIDEVRIYSRALTPAEVAELAGAQ